MTENEKAATFIGWVEICNNCWPCQGPHRPTPGWVHSCREHCEVVPHKIPAPDMNLPQNYMLALENLPINEWTIYRDVERDIECRIGIPAKAIGRTPLEALAAPWDAEHEESKP